MNFKKIIKWAIIVLPVFIALYVFNYIWSVRTHYNYDVTANYGYQNFGDTVIYTQITDGKIFVNVDDKWDSGLLKINIKATNKGKFFNPKVKTGTETHVLERGAQGIRFLNISNHLQLNNHEIQLEFEYCKLADVACELILFNNQSLQNKKILVVSPHPDDAEIAAWGLYSNHESFIVTVTAGDFGPKNYDEIVDNDSIHYLLKGRLRFWNSITVPLLAGVEQKNIVNLSYSDLTLKDMFDYKDSVIASHATGLKNTNYYRQRNFKDATIPESDGRPIWSNLVNDFVFIIENYNPDIIVLPHLLLDYHADHKFSTLAVFEAIRKTGKRNGQFYFYTNHLAGGVRVWPDGRMGDAIDLPPNLCGLGDSIRIHSIKLTANDQLEKTMALEAMNDLRMDLEWLWVKGTWLKFRYRTMKEIMGHEDNYFFKAVRSNELFFVEDFNTAFEN